MAEPKYLTIREFAEKAGIRRQGLYKAYSNPKSKIYPYVRLEGKNVYISQEALTAVYGVVTTADNQTTPETTQETTETTPASVNENQDTPGETTKTTHEVVSETTPETTRQPPITPMESQLYTDYISHLKEEIERLTEEKEVLRQENQKQQEQIIDLSNRFAEISNQALLALKQEQHLTYLDKAPDKQEEVPTPKRSLLKRLFGKD